MQLRNARTHTHTHTHTHRHKIQKLFERRVYILQGIYCSQDRARPALFQNCCVFLCIVCFVSLYVLCVCTCVQYYCHRVSTQLQLTNISKLSTFPVPAARQFFSSSRLQVKIWRPPCKLFNNF